MNNFKIDEFPSEVIDELKSYVYRLIDPSNGETFYIGKGKGNRVFAHLKCAISNEEIIDLKYKRIREISNSGLDVIHIIHRHGLKSEEAFHVEAALIDAYPGSANISGGHYSNDIGPMNAYEILMRYKAEPAIFDHNVLMININRSINNKDTYDAVRFAWKLSVHRAKRAEYILAVEKGIIVGVFKALTWQLATKQNFPEFGDHNDKRYGFVGEEASEEIKEQYLYKRIPEKYRKKGASNPIKYSYN